MPALPGRSSPRREAIIDYFGKQAAIFEQLGAQLAVIANAIGTFTALLAGAGLAVAAWFVAVWVIAAAVVGRAARARGRGGLAWFGLALVLTPLLAGFLLLLFPQR